MKTIIKAVIVDDEPGCISNLQHYITAYCPTIEVIATGPSLSAVSPALKTTTVDILFLDIELSNQNVFDYLDKEYFLTARIVFVTAYDQYAIKAFKVNALDYITKPLSTQDILACYEKIKKWFAIRDAYQPSPQQLAISSSHSFILRQGENIYIVKAADILYLEAKGFYTEVAFMYQGAKRTVLISKLLSRVEKEYYEACFFRVHRSFIINVNNLSSITRHGNMNVKMKTGDIIPIAKRRAHEFLAYVQLKQYP